MSWIQLPPQNVIYSIIAIYLFLLIITAWIYWIKLTGPKKNTPELISRVKTFWVILFLLSISLILKPTYAVVFWAFISYLALKEYFTIIPTRTVDRRVLFWAYIAIPIQYYWIATHWYGMFTIFIPVYVFLFLPFRMVTLGETGGFLHAIGTLHWGVMMMVYCMSCIAALYMLPPNEHTTYGAQGLIVFLLFLNQFNDAAQYFFGKKFGKHKIIPTVSPNKTVEGFLGGVFSTTLISILFAPYLTPVGHKAACILGLIIACSGFIGDIIISALKRDLGIKDTGQILPGHGGILDRIDSLMFTAPLYFHFIHYFYY